ncbi:MAG: hypothetical protein OEW93_05945 [Candidatus Bathyarchaeota archaeon]|nr:hypothetical protein [Candidatus Bathyarchaeota archaeon]MDH5792345.1 hypothetical protein [Candidatus Bathyarchaeota archaeon]
MVLTLLALFMAPTYPSDSGLVVWMSSSEPSWRTEKEMTISFDSDPLSRLFTSYKVQIPCTWDFDSEEDRITIMTFRIYSNDVYVENITSSYELRRCSGGGQFDPVTIPSGTLRAGENKVKVHISIDSTATGPRTRPDLFEFKMDSAVVTENFRLAALLLFSFTSFGIIYYAKIEKT